MNINMHRIERVEAESVSTASTNWLTVTIKGQDGEVTLTLFGMSEAKAARLAAAINEGNEA